MHENATLLRPGAGPQGEGRGSAPLPLDLLDQVRGRVRLLTTLMLIAFACDVVIYTLHWGIERASGKPLSPSLLATLPFQWLNLSIVLASLALRWFAGQRMLPASRLVSLGLIYEVIVCFSVGFSSIWQYYLDKHLVPNLTWVPAIVILFPLILPGPPRRMLTGAIVAALMSPLALWILDLAGKVEADADAYMREIVSATFAVLFAYLGARVVYGLGREVAAARELGSYRLEERLGEGGMGEVWKARHRMLARPAAIKIIRPSLARATGDGIPDDVRLRFEREAQVIAGLRSPHTVVLFDYGVAEGTLYYAMELLEGLDADTFVRRFGPVPPERAVFILRQICHSLSEAESRAIVHRDIKPANIFLCHYGEEFDFVKVLDFGLVKTLD
ncbi:MAG: serine/threonine-protein kinase, partial [Candidatus Eiseniibacteriota bacterium]